MSSKIITTIELSEKELESLIVADPSQIEEGLKLISHQHPTDSGPLDILAVDTGGSLVIIELKIEANEEHLNQGLRYYDWARQNLAWLAKDYSSFGLNPDSPIRLILIAPSFTETVKRIAKYVDAELQLFEYYAIQDSKGEKAIICNEINFGQPPDRPQIPTIDEKIKYVTNQEAQKTLIDALATLKESGIEERPIRGGPWMSFRFQGKCFMYITARRNFFVVDVKDFRDINDNWLDRTRIASKAEWEKFFQEHILPYVNKLKTKNT